MADLLRSALLTRHGFRHGFSLRTGGVSEGPYRSLNLGRTVGDRPEHVGENLHRFAGAVPFSEGELYEVSQVHGAGVRRVGRVEAPADVRRHRADALIGQGVGMTLGVRVADCGSVLLACRRTGAVAAAHAGWRGVVAEVIPATVSALTDSYGSCPEDLLAVVGPHIRAAHFEVGAEVAAQIAAAAPGLSVVLPRSPRPHVDLTAVIVDQLRRAGVPVAQIEDLGGCSVGEPERFFSHRRDRGRTGRHLAVVVGR